MVQQTARDVPYTATRITVFPLHEDSQPIHHEPVQTLELLLSLAYFEVIVPSAQNRIDLTDDLLQAQRVTPSNLAADLFLQ